jgi:uncharacterized membrane protein YdcZ (DUF606 family)
MDKGVAVAAAIGGWSLPRPGWLGVERSPISVAKIAGLVLLGVGTWLVIRE